MNAKTSEKKVIIVGGVAGGANVAARLRRLDENCKITMYERGGYVSFANCGLPYHIGGEIEKRQKLLLHTPESLKQRFAIDVFVRTEVLSVDRKAKKVSVKNLDTGELSEQSYDVLVLSPGAVPLRPNIPGMDLPGIYVLRDIKDMDSIIARLNKSDPKNLVVVGGGFIGLEMVEQLHKKLGSTGAKISLLEAGPHVLPPLDWEMATAVEDELKANDIELKLGDPVVAFEIESQVLQVKTKSGAALPADVVIFSIGVRPETTLAVAAGLEIGQRGGVKVNSKLQTSDPSIFALGDCIETKNFVTSEIGLIPLAGPANRQGRIVADVICGKDSEYKGTLGTAIVRVFGLTAAVTGVNQRTLDRTGIKYQVEYLHPASHAGYYPGAKPIHLKVLFSPEDGKILGAQAVGHEGIDKRIDVIATAIYAGLKVEELKELELCYAPPFSSAKDPVNMAGMIAENIRGGLVEAISPDRFMNEANTSCILDVRDADEREGGYIPGSVHIPLSDLRSRLKELAIDKQIIVYCQSGQRSYMACRILSQHGFRCLNLSGAFKTWKLAEAALRR